MFRYGEIVWVDGGPLQVKVISDNGDEYDTVLVILIALGEIRYVKRSRLRYQRNKESCHASER